MYISESGKVKEMTLALGEDGIYSTTFRVDEEFVSEPWRISFVVLEDKVGNVSITYNSNVHSGLGARLFQLEILKLRKESFDIAGSAALLLLASPVLGALGLGVWASSGRPIFYRQARMGHDGRVFRMLKFRSMKRDAEEEGPGWTTEDDPRRTRFGRFMRRYNLDELPQLLNVLWGDMSLVGPRPERPAYIESFRREVPGYMLRHKVRAGMTGWAQVHGWRGDTSIHERVEHDLYYIQKWSLWLDVRILIMTLFRGRRGGY